MTMDATRKRRTRDRARQAWYARCRQLRFARFLGFLSCQSGLPPISGIVGEDGRVMVSEWPRIERCVGS
jgi:hypothetical protein